MVVICGPITETISYGNKLICNRLVKISNIHQYYETIEVMIDNQQIISGIGNVSVYLIPDFTKKAVIKLIGKNVSAGTATISFAIETVEAPPPIVEYTDTIKLYLKPWGWYSPGQATDKLIGKIADINGTMANYFAGITDYQYVRTDIATEGEYTTVNIRLKELQAMGSIGSESDIKSMVVPLVAILAIIAAVTKLIIAICILIGVIGLYQWINRPTGETKVSDTPPPKEVLPGVQDANTNANINCLTTLPASPTCDQIKNYTVCLDSVHMGLYGTLKAVYPNSPDIASDYQKYLRIYENLAANCNPAIPGNTPNDLVNQINMIKKEYQNELTKTFEKLQEDYAKCRYMIGGYCMDDIITIGGLALGGYIIYRLVRKGG
jgi:hypothetical protein